MAFVNIFTSVVIVFVAINLAWLIYQFLNRKLREGLENSQASNDVMIMDATSCSDGGDCSIEGQFCPKGVPGASGNYLCKNKKWVKVDSRPTEASSTASSAASSSASTNISTTCPNGCKNPTEIDGNCDPVKPGDTSVTCYKRCPGPEDSDYSPDQECEYSSQCKKCGAYKLPIDAQGNVVTNTINGVVTALKPVSGKSIAMTAESTGLTSTTLDNDTAESYNQSSPASATESYCNPMSVHNEGADNSTYGQWFPQKITSLNLSQSQYETAGRRFLNDESVKKGVSIPKILDSEAEVLGRLLWRVHIDAINQYCSKNSDSSVSTTMNDELKLMQKLHSIQSSPCPSSLTPSASSVPSNTCPQENTSTATTGVMTDTRPSGNITSSQQYDISEQSATGYTNTYRPRDPALKPKPYDSIFNIF